MLATLRIWFRAITVILALGFVTSPLAEATGSAIRNEAPAPRRSTLWGLPRDDPAIAIGAIIAAIVLIVVIAWIASHVGDKA